ncbi:MAG: lysylphosphatidylglycerol synthase domain-containing protein [Dissulfurispiraceae bacterium]
MTSPSDKTSRVGNKKTCETSSGDSTFRLGSIIALLVGAAISAALIVSHNFSSVVQAAHNIGWGFMLVLIIQISGIALNGLAWRALFRSEQTGFTGTLLILRWIRESVNYLLPVGRLGGDMAAVRLLVARGRNVNTAVASIVADKTLEVLGLFFFSLAGIVILFERGGDSSVEHWAVRALVTILAVLIAFLAAQRWGLLRLVDKGVHKLVGTCADMYGSNVASIHEMVWAIYADSPRLILAAFLHAIAWVPGALQIWAAAHFMGLGIGLTGAFIIESLTMVVCAAAFIMPASLGAQEAAYMTIGWWLFGIPPAAGLALSLIQRLKDVFFGIPGLLVWQWFEGSRLWMLWRGRRK